MGDDVQAIKAGIMEIADVFVINKSDRPGADLLERELNAMLSIAGRRGGWRPPIVSAVATEGKGTGDILAAVRRFQESGARTNRRVELWSMRLREMLRERLLDRLPEEEVERAAAEVASRRRDPYSIVDEWLERI
jgi:LAO/AO transport system kinase